MSDRFNVNTSLSRNWEHVNTKFVGTGHPDISRQCVWQAEPLVLSPWPPSLTPSPPPAHTLLPSEFASHHHRDTHSTLLGHSDMLLFASAAEGVTSARMKFMLLERMAAPVGPPPAQSPAALLAKQVLERAGAAQGK